MTRAADLPAVDGHGTIGATPINVVGDNPLQMWRTMKCTGGRVVRFLVCLQFFRPSPVISDVIALTPQMFRVFACTNDCCNARLESCRSAFALANLRFKRFNPPLAISCVQAARNS
ncbi:hypothetical protein Poly51_48700 [Rubripirellula tenax]|uniref:Uncharacterized protein n=1 Tax=Rubripirellula tenax TaxID=2528015 RepID=A0A5C6EN26_9BACT|nr:hypothetical protein Poly51_48700 [Rubripirellula tenax]